MPPGPVIAAAMLVLAGCGNNADKIRAYAIPKEAPPQVTPGAAPPPAVPIGVMAWDLPPGWTDAPNTNSMRFATITAGEGESLLEVAITQLGGAGGGIANNINRWRGQVGLEALSEQELTQTVRALDARGTRGMFIDLAGPAAEGAATDPPGMLAAIFVTDTHSWFIKGAGPMSTIDVHRDAFVELCESVRFVDPSGGGEPPAGAMSSGSPGASAPPADSGASGTQGTDDSLVWGDVPSTWSADSPARSMAVASFTIREAGSEAALTITPLGGNQDMLANVNRWRRQIGLGPLASVGEQEIESIEVAGDPATFVDIVGPEARTLGVIATRGPTTWFYKLSGPADLVGGERAAFETFMRSIRFDGET